MKGRINTIKAIEMVNTDIQKVPLCTLADLMTMSLYDSRITEDIFNRICIEVAKRDSKQLPGSIR